MKRTENIQKELFALKDDGYREFHSRLMPNVAAERVIGVRVPDLRRLAKRLKNTAIAERFIAELPHAYYEEYNLHALWIMEMKDYDCAIAETERLLPYIDNWATCDLLSPKVFTKYKSELLEKIKEWMDSDHVYTVRFGMGMLMRHYLDADFREEYLGWVSAVKGEDYYIRMMTAWYFATALAKQYDAAVKYLEEDRLEKWTHNKTIQKAIESYRITPEQKAYLKTLRKK